MVLAVLVHILLAFSCTAVTLDLHVLYGELVVIGQLFPREDFSQGKNNNVFLPKNVYNLAVAIWLKSLINFFSNLET